MCNVLFAVICKLLYMVLCCDMICSNVLCSDLLCSDDLCSDLLCNYVLCNNVLWSLLYKVLCNAVLYKFSREGPTSLVCSALKKKYTNKKKKLEAPLIADPPPLKLHQ